MEIKHGQKVKFTHRLKRTTQTRQTEVTSGRTYNTLWKVWAEIPYQGDGLFLGMRTLRNGTRYWLDEAGYVFEPKEYIQTALISQDSTSNPFYVPLDCLEVVDK